MTKNNINTFAMHDSLFTTVIDEINLLRNDINSGENITNADSKLKLINKKLQELKDGYTINNENKRQIINEIDKIDNAFFDDNIEPKISEGNIQKMLFVELINPESMLTDTKSFIESAETKLESIIKQIEDKTTNDDKKFKEYTQVIPDYINSLSTINSNINGAIVKIETINNSYKKYIDDFNNFTFDLTDNYFYPNECIENEMILYSKINDTNKKEDTNLDNEFELIKQSIIHMNISKNENITDIINDPASLDKLLLGGAGTVTKSSAGTVTKSSAETVTKSSAGTVTKSSAGTVTKSSAGTVTKSSAEKKINIDGKKKPLLDNIISTGISSGDNYYLNIMNYTFELEKLQQTFNNFKNKCREYNIQYVRMYNHILFIINYLKLVVQDRNKNYQIYNYIGLNTIIYYNEIVDSIIKSMKNKTTLGNYFSKYHYINIQILRYFLGYIHTNWKKYNNYCDNFSQLNDKIPNAVKKVISKLYLYDSTLMKNQKIKKSVFIFNAMKDLLDKFKSLSSPPVAVYLRINHNPTIQIKKEVFKKNMGKIGYLDNETVQSCINNQSKIGDIKFAEVFDSESFNDNSVLSKYMSIPTFLSQGKSIMLLTYGYSGVGKTFTIFGTKNTSGMLQSSLNNIQQREAIYFRAYELYGLAFPYKSYWDKKSSDYYHFIYDYTKNNKNPTEYKSEFINNFIQDISNIPTQANSTFISLSDNNIKDFQSIINNIDNVREKEGRIKWTINNPKSSRSIMIFDFKIKLANNNYVNFVIVDLPGKENIKETYVNNNSCIKLKNNYSPYIRNMAFLSPLSLMISENYAELFIKENESILNEPDFTITFGGKDYKKNSHDFYTKMNSLFNPTTYYNGLQVKALEIMRHIIINNRFDLLQTFYEKNFFTLAPGCTNKNYSIAPFEGYYINENIIGLLSTLLKKYNLKHTVIEEQDEIFLTQAKIHKNFEDNARYESGIPYYDNIKDEIRSQTYFFRYLSRKSNIIWDTEFCGKLLNEWIDDSYDYNKSFNRDNPPIASLLEPYFTNIKNFYLFYVVSNDNETQCDKQIKLINDSKIFLDELNNYEYKKK